MKITIQVLVLVCASLGSLLFFEKKENARLQMIITISEERDKINQDQIRDMEFELTNAKTYDDGFHDAIMYGGSKSYVDGYHRAIGQNQEQIRYLQAQLDKKNTTSVAEKKE